MLFVRSFIKKKQHDDLHNVFVFRFIARRYKLYARAIITIEQLRNVRKLTDNIISIGTHFRRADMRVCAAVFISFTCRLVVILI